ncbi:MAG: ComEC/Rec2 family competence protein [Henriciella sp.]
MQRFPLSAADFQLQSHGPVLFAMGMMLGTAWYFTINFEPGLWGITLFSLVVLLGGIVAVRYALANALIVAFVVCCGAGMGALSGSLASARVQTVTVQSEMGPVRLEGWIENALPATRGTRLVIKVHAIDGLPSNETPKRVRLTHISALQTEPGRFVQCWAVLRPPPAPVLAEDYAFDRHAWYGGLGAVGYVQGRCRGGVMGGPQGASGAFSNWVSIQRRQLAQHVYEAAGQRAGGFAAALASGDRSFMAMEDQEALRGAGLAHLLAISGLHMGIVGGIVFLLVWRSLSLIEPIALRWPVKKPAAAAALIACLIYLVISGASVSTQRAFIMAAVLFGAVLMASRRCALLTIRRRSHVPSS